MKKPVDLRKINATNSKLHVKPHQLVIREKTGTVIFFRSGKFRVMGCVDPIDATFLALKYTFEIDKDDIPEIYSQSYTCTKKLGYNINLYKLSQCTCTLYNPELFGAIRMTKYNPVSVNVFSTGSVVACGLKEPEDFYVILEEIEAVCKLINMPIF